MPAEAGDDAVRGSGVLDLGPAPLARHIRVREPFGHNAVQARALETVEPVGGDRRVARRRRQVDRRRGVAQRNLEQLAAFPLRSGAQVPVVEGEQIPGHVAGGGLGREQLHPRGRRVNPQQQRVEVEPIGARDDDLAVEDAASRQIRSQGRRQLREVAVQRLEVAALDEHLVAVSEDESPEAVPFGLVLPAGASRDLVRELSQHRLDRRLQRQVHAPTIAEAAASADSLRSRGCRGARPAVAGSSQLTAADGSPFRHLRLVGVLDADRALPVRRGPRTGWATHAGERGSSRVCAPRPRRSPTPSPFESPKLRG